MDRHHGTKDLEKEKRPSVKAAANGEKWSGAGRPRRLRKTVFGRPQRRVKKSRRSAARRGEVRRSNDTYFGKIDRRLKNRKFCLPWKKT
jgi:hypothetical protein